MALPRPALGFFALFVGFPVAYAFYLSFHEWNLMSPAPAWVGSPTTGSSSRT